MEYSNNKFTEFEKVVDDKIKYLEEKIDNLRVENNKYSTNLIDQSKIMLNPNGHFYINILKKFQKKLYLFQNLKYVFHK